MRTPCSLLHNGVCRHDVIGPAIVQPIDCEHCVAYNGADSEEMQQLAIYKDKLHTIDSTQRCKHLGTKLKIAECCGQMYACKFHKGKKCAPVGIAQDPFLSCQICSDFDSIDGIQPTIIDRDRFAGRCVAVTSLSPDPDRSARQELCLQSWRDIGLQVLTVETDSKPRIKALLDAGSATGMPFLLMNADIEIYGDHTLIESAIGSPNKLAVGIRYNHSPDAQRGRSRKETAGIDAFLMTPAMADTVPDLPFMIGEPVWDYWLPYHFRRLGYAFHWIDSPLFFHATHDIQWSRQDWVRGSEVLNEHYGVSLEYGSTAFRDSLN